MSGGQKRLIEEAAPGTIRGECMPSRYLLVTRVNRNRTQPVDARS
jgi:hypothetical protein